jgi:hypothetical protein
MAGNVPNNFISERVESLAIMYLTRRPDLIVRREIRQVDKVMDLIVEITEQGKPPGWKKFGIYLQGTKTPVTIAEANGKLKFSLRRFFNSYGEPSIPFCLFYFTMVDNQGYFTWVAEPIVNQDRYRLRYHKEQAKCVKLTDEVIGTMTASVNAYYEAFYNNAIRD